MSLLLGLLFGISAPVLADDYAKLAAELSKGAISHAKRRVAVLAFRSVGATGGAAGTFVSEKITGPLLADERLQVVERAMLQSVLKEQRLQISGATDSRSIKELGRILGADAIITGTILALKDNRVEINARLIDSETARVLGVATARVEKEWSESMGDSVFDVSVPPLGNFETDDFHNTVAEDDTNCSSARSRAAEIDRSMVDLKARYWAARLRSPGFSRASLTQNPGSEIEDPGVKADFYDRLNRYYHENRTISQDEIEQLNVGQNQIRKINDMCHTGGA